MDPWNYRLPSFECTILSVVLKTPVLSPGEAGVAGSVPGGVEGGGARARRGVCARARRRARPRAHQPADRRRRTVAGAVAARCRQ